MREGRRNLWLALLEKEGLPFFPPGKPCHHIAGSFSSFDDFCVDVIFLKFLQDNFRTSASVRRRIDTGDPNEISGQFYNLIVREVLIHFLSFLIPKQVLNSIVL